MIRFHRPVILFIPVLFLLAACDLVSIGDEPPTSTPEPTQAVATPQPVATSPSAIIQTPVPPVTELRVWIPPEIGAQTEAGTQILNSQLREFEAAHNNLSILVEQKPVEGPGGILSYLRTGREVAPGVMPDLIALPTALLSEPVVQDLVFPLGELAGDDMIANLYPASMTGVVREDRLFGLPFTSSGLTHLVYDPSVITQTVPLAWSQFISETNHTLVLPADSREGAMFGLQFYLAEGGLLVDEAGQPNLDVGPLTQALDQIRLNKTNLLQSQQMKTLDEAWQYYQLGLSQFVWTATDFFLRQRVQESGGTSMPSVQNQGFLPVPGPSGPLVPLTNSWAWALSTPDAARQVLAGELMQWLVEPANLAEWSQQSHTLPAMRDAMGVLAEQDPYYLFSGREMERAVAMPIRQSSKILDVMGEAVFQALTTDTPSEVLAENAVTTLRQ